MQKCTRPRARRRCAVVIKQLGRPEGRPAELKSPVRAIASREDGRRIFLSLAVERYALLPQQS